VLVLFRYFLILIQTLASHARDGTMLEGDWHCGEQRRRRRIMLRQQDMGDRQQQLD
jgi:hypothetical protein